jgi:heterodisulfide reductase subunit A
MYSLKLAHLVHESCRAEVVEFYRDMRTFGKGYESFYEKVRGEGVEFRRFDGEIRISRANGRLVVEARDVYSGESEPTPVDLVVLGTALEAHSDQGEVAKRYGVSLSPDGFFMERHPKLAPVETATEGVFLAGACQGPKDIPDSVAQGSAAAAAALSMMDAGSVSLEPYTASVREEMCGGCRTCEGLCPYGAISMVEIGERLVAEVNQVLCKGCGACAAACPAGAATQHGFTDAQLVAEITGALQEAVL